MIVAAFILFYFGIGLLIGAYGGIGMPDWKAYAWLALIWPLLVFVVIVSWLGEGGDRMCMTGLTVVMVTIGTAAHANVPPQTYHVDVPISEWSVGAEVFANPYADGHTKNDYVVTKLGIFSDHGTEQKTLGMLVNRKTGRQYVFIDAIGGATRYWIILSPQEIAAIRKMKAKGLKP